MTLEDHLHAIEELSQKGETQRALEEADEIVRGWPRDYRCWHLRSDLLAAKRKYNDAIQDLDRAIELNGSEPVLLFDRGRYRLMQRDAQKAVCDFTAGLELCKKVEDNYYLEAFRFLRAEAYLAMGKKTEALEDLEQVREEVVLWTTRVRSKRELLAAVEALP